MQTEKKSAIQPVKETGKSRMIIKGAMTLLKRGEELPTELGSSNAQGNTPQVLGKDLAVVKPGTQERSIIADTSSTMTLHPTLQMTINMGSIPPQLKSPKASEKDTEMDWNTGKQKTPVKKQDEPAQESGTSGQGVNTFPVFEEHHREQKGSSNR